VVGGVDARGAVLAEPPETQGAEDGEGLAGGGGGGVGLEDVGPDDGVAVQNSGAVGPAVVDVRVGGGFEGGKAGFPGGIDVVGAEAPVQGSLADLSVGARAVNLEPID